MFKTSQVISFKNAIEGISTLVQDCNFQISPEQGIIIRELDKTEKILVFARFEKESFDTFTFEDDIIIGVDLIAFCKCLKSASPSDILEVTPSEGYIHIILRGNRITKTFKLKLLTLDILQKKISPVNFDFQITISSSIFNTWCKTLYNNCDKVTMRTTSHNLTFTGALDIGDLEFAISNGRDLEIINSGKDTVSGCYDLKFFLLFSKSGNSDETVIFVKEDYPLVVQYNLQNLGVLKMCLQI